MARNMTRKLSRQEKLDKFRDSEEVIAGLPIVRLTEKLMEVLNALVVEYPRYERYALGSQTRQVMQDFFELVVTAAKKYTKKTTLRDADIKFFLLKRLIHIALRRRYISIGQYEELVTNYLLDIGKQLGGWLAKETEKENQNQGRKQG